MEYPNIKNYLKALLLFEISGLLGNILALFVRTYYNKGFSPLTFPITFMIILCFIIFIYIVDFLITNFGD